MNKVLQIYNQLDKVFNEKQRHNWLYTYNTHLNNRPIMLILKSEDDCNRVLSYINQVFNDIKIVKLV